MAIVCSNSEVIGDIREANFIRLMGKKATLIEVEEVIVISLLIYGSLRQ